MMGVKYDDASWHSEGDVPADLPPEAAVTQVGFLLAWAVLRGLSSSRVESSKTFLTERTTSPGQFCLQECDGKLLDEDLSDEGNQFTSWYYEALYYKDLDAEFHSAARRSIYHIEDAWENFDRLGSGSMFACGSFAFAG